MTHQIGKITVLSTIILWVIVLILLLFISWAFATPYTVKSRLPSHFITEDDIFIPEIEEEQEFAIVIEEPIVYEFIEIIDGCETTVDSTCITAHTLPSSTSSVVASVRKGTVLKTQKKIETNEGSWYHVVFDEWLRYPERLTSEWYIPATGTRSILDQGFMELSGTTTPKTDKLIIVDQSDQKMYAYYGDELYMEQSISTGITVTPTPKGRFTIFKKTPTRYMQGPLPGISKKYYDLPGVPWNLYFTHQGAVIHGAYWHDQFGKKWSNGCVNLSPSQAQRLYMWADIGTPVWVRD